MLVITTSWAHGNMPKASMRKLSDLLTGSVLRLHFAFQADIGRLKALALGDKSSTYVTLDGKAAAMNKLDEWRRQAYEVAVKLCRDYGRDGKNAFKVSTLLLISQYRGRIPNLMCMVAMVQEVRHSPLHGHVHSSPRIPRPRRLPLHHPTRLRPNNTFKSPHLHPTRPLRSQPTSIGPRD